MGSPLSPVVASIALERIEQSALAELRGKGIAPVFFKRYVDDCLVAAKNEQQMEILNTFNSFHQRLQFTIEHETDVIDTLQDPRVYDSHINDPYVHDPQVLDHHIHDPHMCAILRRGVKG
ncbi:uncharacterized protein LOC129753265 [Uranotaenia lowii]|uniref:uncharacterized protein LOC129753265 n=1 Tax=Uranotaenia lowii TaxID=190385 RepID=UPI00247848BE|nr:uncharacterized protein LOC129753265 [Uranotaenia lowii]